MTQTKICRAVGRGRRRLVFRAAEAGRQQLLVGAFLKSHECALAAFTVLRIRAGPVDEVEPELDSIDVVPHMGGGGTCDIEAELELDSIDVVLRV